MLHSQSSFERSATEARAAEPHGGGATHEVFSGEAEAVKVPVLGKTLLFRGELTAEEDVILQGRVEGSIRHARNLVIGTEGSVLGDVYARHLTVEGLVEGDLHCSEAVVVRATAQVRGNIHAPRVGIMEGATFNGRVEMGSAGAVQAGGEGGRAKSSAPARAPGAPAPAARQAPVAPRGGVQPGGSAEAAGALSDVTVDRMLASQSGARK